MKFLRWLLFLILWIGGVSQLGRKKDQAGLKGKVVVIIPAFNEADVLANTYKALIEQSLPPDKIIVIDDGSDDETGRIAQNLGAEVIKFKHPSGSKARAINKSLALLDLKEFEYLAIVDADTHLDKTALEKAVARFNSSKIAAVCGYVLSGQTRTFWQKARSIEYLVGGALDKGAQEWWGIPLIMAGCFTVWRREILVKKGFPEDTFTEDLDLTWQLISEGYRVVYASEARCFTIDPQNYKEIRSQLLRWKRGFLQNVVKHKRNWMRKPIMAFFILRWLFEALGSILYFGLLGWLAATSNWQWLAILIGSEIAYLSLIALIQGLRLGYLPKVVLNTGCYWLARPIFQWLFFEALAKEIWSRIRKEKAMTWSKTRKKGVIEMYQPLGMPTGLIFRFPLLAILTIALLVVPYEVAQRQGATIIGQLPKASIAFTFDDGSRTVYTKAFPILKKCQAVGTVFVVTSQVTSPAYLSWEELRKLAESGWEIASQGVSHRDLTTLDDEELMSELVHSKDQLQRQGFDVFSFASPFGAYNEKTLEAIKKVYLAHRTLEPGINYRPIDSYLIKAFDVNFHKLDDLDKAFELILRTKETNGHLVLVFHHIDEKEEQFSEFNYPGWKLEALCLYARELGFELYQKIGK